MANRALANKATRAAKQSREAGHMEATKSAYLVGTSKAELRRMMAAFYASDGAKGRITRLPKGEATGLHKDVGRCGKASRTRATRCYGDGTRRNARSLVFGISAR